MPIATDQRSCLWCGDSIEHMWQRATYCCRQHKKNAASARHRQRNPGYYKRYYQTPRAVEWRQDNREEVKQRQRERFRDNGLSVRQQETAAAWRAANRDRLRVNQRNYITRKWSNPDSVNVSISDWMRLCRRYGYRCVYCGTQPAVLQMDHVVPLSRGGRHGIGNMLPACGPCNISKNNLLLIEWRVRDGRAPV